MNIEQLSETRKMILLALKQIGPITIAELSSHLEMTREAVRQHIIQLESEGWIEKQPIRGNNIGGGRPSMCYRITSEGEHLFPKHYDVLAVEVLDTVAKLHGTGVLTQILANMTETRIRQWEPRLRGLSVEERVEALTEIYATKDSYMDIERSEGRLCLIERNCPFYNIASKRSELCSVTVSTLTHLLGCRVVREERFQRGDGRCVFHILTDQPVDSRSYSFSVEA